MCEEWKIPRKSHFHSSELILFPRFPGNGNDFFGNPEEKSQKLISICSNFPKNEGKSKKWECSGNEEFSGKISYSAGIWRDWEKDFPNCPIRGNEPFSSKVTVWTSLVRNEYLSKLSRSKWADFTHFESIIFNLHNKCFLTSKVRLLVVNVVWENIFF